MLTDPPIEQLLPKAECAYELVALVSKRARQLVDGAQPMIPDSAANMVSLACKEVAQGKVVCVSGDKEQSTFVPKTREAREAIAAALKAKEEAEYYKHFSAQFESEKERMEADQMFTDVMNNAVVEETEDAIVADDSSEIIEETDEESSEIEE